MKKIFTIILLLAIYCAHTCVAASLSVKPSEIYVIAGQQTVTFTCEVIISETEKPETITLEIDYQNDDMIDDSKTFSKPEDGKVKCTFEHLFSEAGYWDTVVTVSVDGEKEVLDPLTINVARWKFPSEGAVGGIATTPAVGDDGTIYFGSEDGMLYAVNPEGYLKWGFRTGGPVNSSPAMDSGGNIYFGSSDRYLYCLTPDNREKWQPFLAGDIIFGSPALNRDEKTVYFGCVDGCLYALDTETGNAKWQMPFQTGGKIVSSPVVGFDGTVYIGSLDHHLYAINPDGSCLWAKDLAAGIYGGISLDGDGTIYIGTCQYGGAKDALNRLFAISSTGFEKWHVDVLSGFASTPIIQSPGTILAGSYDNTLYAYDRNGERLWDFAKFSDDILSSPAAGSNGLAYIASKDGMIYALLDDWDYYTDRELAWKYDMEMPVTTSSPVVANGSVYIGTYAREGGVLWAFAAESEAMAEKLENAVTEADPESPWPMMRNDKENSGRSGLDSDTIAPGVVKTDPANGVMDFDVHRNSISVTFSKPVSPDLIYVAPTETDEGYYGFTITSFENDPSEFEIRWVSDTTVELVLPSGVAFEKETVYTAVIETRSADDSGDTTGDCGADPERLLDSYSWQFSYTTPEKEKSSGDTGCFVSILLN